MIDDPHCDSEYAEPRIIGRRDHSVSRKLIDPDALKVLYRLCNNGYKAYLVGGGVRDLLLGKTPKDFDVATDAKPEEVRRLFRNSRIIGRRFRLAHVFFHGNKIVEVSTFRRSVTSLPAIELEPTNGDDPPDDAIAPIDDPDHGPNGDQDGADDFETASSDEHRIPPTENDYGTAEEDAKRRDITINALFYNIADFSIIDYVGGMDDLQNRVVRSVGCPHRSIKEDPVRMIRVIRHAARTGFAIDPATWEAILEHARLIVHCSPARVREEFLRDLRGGASHLSFQMMVETGLLPVLFPAYEEVLAGEDGERTKEWLLRNLRGIDALNRKGPPLSDPMLLAAFVAPFVRHARVLERAPEERARVPYFHSEVREVIKPIIRSFGFSKAHAENICQTVIGMLLMETAAREDRPLPRSLVGKVYFGDGYKLYCVECEGRGDRLPPEFHQAFRKWEQKFTRRRDGGPAEAERDVPAPEPGRDGGPHRRRRRRSRRPKSPAEAAV
ncbi:MAG: polynucleotide adenylyltransferase PcnB [Deltaproteobacteria bacterium]|nr:polynucleotide adenylyltransferase PcnB [Deltaproteobacteria bacterium]